MHARYEIPQIAAIWANPNRVGLWQHTEWAVLEARVLLGQLDNQIYVDIFDILSRNPIDIAWWEKRDAEVRHDLNAFIDERVRFLPLYLRRYFHEKLTSYDTEEPAFAQMLKQSLALVESALQDICNVLEKMALRYRYTVMIGRTHGQEAELQTFGKRCLTWLRIVRVDIDNLQRAMSNLQYSKLSGAIGNYGTMDPVVEETALRILGFQPFYGATQIMPRELYAPIAQALCQVVLTLDKIALDIRLGARSGRPIYQEPFGRQQKGSSRMPQKKNTISTEQMEGMARMAKGYSSMIQENIITWEERAIEQSSVERVGWPDLLHIVVYSTKVMTRVLDGLAVYPDNMLWEVVDSGGCYAAGEAKDFLAEKGAALNLSSEEAYRIVQLAAFNAFAPSVVAEHMRANPLASFAEAKDALAEFGKTNRAKTRSIQEIISEDRLKMSPELGATEDDMRKWNEILEAIFLDSVNYAEFAKLFSPEHLLTGEAKLYEEILGK